MKVNSQQLNLNDNGSLTKIYAGSTIDINGFPGWLPKANFSKTQTDLLITSPAGDEILLVDFFTNFELPSLKTENGLLLKGTLIDTLSGSFTPGQYAQANDANVLSIGEVSSVTGEAKATRLDGTTVNLSTGDPVFQGDTVETTGAGAIGLVFLDKTTLSLSEGGKMVLDELVYDPATGTGSMAVDMVEGAFSFVSGEIAKTGPDAMKVSTPVATIGIRGTTVAGKAAVEGNENSFTLLQDADGGVGQISVSNAGGTQVLAQVGATTSITSFTAPPPPPIILSAAQIQANYGTALNVLPPTPVVAPSPQPPPPPQEQQQEQVQEEESQEEEEEAVEEELQEEGEGPPEGEEGEGPPEGEEGPPIGPDGEPLVEEGPPEGDGPPIGPDGEPLAEGEGGPPIGPDGEPLADGPPIGPDGEPLPPGDFGPGGPPIGPDGEPLADGPPIGPDGEPLPPGDFGPGGPTPEQDAAAREAFETALAAGLSPEEAMAEAAAAAGIPPPPGGFGGDPLSATVGGDDFAGGPLGPGGPGDIGPGGPGDFGPGGPADFGPGGPVGFGGPGDFAPGGPGDFGPGGPADFGPGGPADFGPGGPADFGPGGPADFGPGGPGDFDPGGPGDFGPGGGPGNFDSSSGGDQGSFGTFLPPGSFQPPGTVQQPGAYIPAQVGFAPIAPVTTAPVIGSGFSGNDGGGFHGGPGGPIGFDPGGGPGDFGPGGPGDFGPGGPSGFGPDGFDPGGFGPAGFGPGGFGPGGFGPGGFGPAGFGPSGFGPSGFVPGGFDPYGPDPFGGVPAGDSYYEDASMFENIGEAEGYEPESGSSGGSGSSGTTFVGSSSADSEDKSSESTAWRFEGYSGADNFIGGSGNDVFWGAIDGDTLTGNAGQDTFYFGDLTEGNDTITDFTVGAGGDILQFSTSVQTSAYARDASVVNMVQLHGTTYNMGLNSNVLPSVFNFTSQFSSANTTTGVTNQLTSFKVTTDGSTAISSPTDFIIVTGDTSTNGHVYGWSDGGNGVIDNGELFGLATLTGVDNDNIGATNFTFGPI